MSLQTAAETTETIAVSALRIGMFVHLDLGWMSHPFALSSFKITSAEQLQMLRALGVAQVRWSPSLSTHATPVVEHPAAPGVPTALLEKSEAEKTALSHRAAWSQQRARLSECEQQFSEATRASKQIFDHAEAQPQAAAAQAVALSQAIVSKMLGERDLCIRLLNDGAGDRSSAHAVNVAVLSLLLGRTLQLNEAELCDLGTGALLHDIGKRALPLPLRHRDPQFSAAQHSGYENHVAQGLLQAHRMGLSEGATQVIAQHHEHADGSGFPQRLSGDRITIAARITALVNRYDNLCNPHAGGLGSTPHEAVALLFSQGRHQFDSGLLGQFIRMLGVYPPGSAVQLTDSRYALVVGVNALRPLKPRVLVHEAGVPYDEAVIVDLERQPGVGVLRSIRPQALPPQALQYLAPRTRVSYFFEPQLARAG